MIAIAYTRRSKKSEGRTVSLGEQARHIEAYCAGHGLTLVSLVSHDGVSGTKRNRFPDISAAIRAHNAGALVVYNLDRLARDCSALVEEFRAYRRAGVELHESTSGLIGDSALDQFMLQVRAANDELYARITGQKTRGALAYLKSEGRQYSRIAPFGYAYIQGRLVINEEENRVIGQVMHFGLEGLTAAAIEDRVRATGYTGRLSVRTIQRVLQRAK